MDGRRKPGLGQRAILALVSWYVKACPIRFGKYPLKCACLNRFGPTELIARTKEGEEFELRFPEDHGWEDLFFRGQFETGSLEAVRRVVRPGDVVFDIGANLGWYTVKLAKLAAPGACHAFEPMPEMFERLRRNWQRNRSGAEADAFLNPLAVGREAGQAILHSFAGLPAGQNSLSNLGRDDFQAIPVPQTSLDDYAREHGVSRVDFIKIDVEGAEREVLHGATGLLSAESPPVWLLEMNQETAGHFGYPPHELLEHLRGFGPCDFYRIVKGWGRILRMSSPRDYEHADNVLCVPHRSPKAGLVITS